MAWMVSGSALVLMDMVSCFRSLLILANQYKGMARIFQCAPGLVKLIIGGPWSATGMPECFQFSKGRISHIRKQTGDK